MPDRSNGISLRSGFLHHAEKNPNAPAAVVRGITRSYGELHSMAATLAGAVTDAVGGRPERIGVFTYRSDTAYAATLAALFAGAAFVPLNPNFPPAYTASLMSQADLDAIIVDNTCLPQLASVLRDPGSVWIVAPNADREQVSVGTRILDRRDLLSTRARRELPPVTPEDTAYLLFTSGSTGVAKGVPVTHGNVTYFMEIMSRRYAIRPEDRFSQAFDQTFDLSVFDLFMAWTNGAAVYTMSPVDLLSPAKFINQHRLTVWFSVPSVAAQMCRRKTLHPGILPSLRWSLFCGEPLPQPIAEAWQLAAPNSTLENLYGPTELTIACFVHSWDPIRSPALCRNGVVPIGRPHDGLMALVADENLNLVADGGTGELCVSGPQTTPGYWRTPDITAERYVSLPVSRHETRLFYRTGDLVTRLAEGDYIFLGRADQQIKVLGHRVELGEIEAALRAQPGVEHAVAFGWPPSGSAAESVIAVVSGDDPDIERLFTAAKAMLPLCAVPRLIFTVLEMPLNANGKIDRRALEKRFGAELAQTTGI